MEGERERGRGKEGERKKKSLKKCRELQRTTAGVPSCPIGCDRVIPEWPSWSPPISALLQGHGGDGLLRQQLRFVSVIRMRGGCCGIAERPLGPGCQAVSTAQRVTDCPRIFSAVCWSLTAEANRKLPGTTEPQVAHGLNVVFLSCINKIPCVKALKHLPAGASSSSLSISVPPSGCSNHREPQGAFCAGSEHAENCPQRRTFASCPCLAAVPKPPSPLCCPLPGTGHSIAVPHWCFWGAHNTFMVVGKLVGIRDLAFSYAFEGLSLALLTSPTLFWLWPCTGSPARKGHEKNEGIWPSQAVSQAPSILSCPGHQDRDVSLATRMGVLRPCCRCIQLRIPLPPVLHQYWGQGKVGTWLSNRHTCPWDPLFLPSCFASPSAWWEMGQVLATNLPSLTSTVCTSCFLGFSKPLWHECCKQACCTFVLFLLFGKNFVDCWVVHREWEHAPLASNPVRARHVLVAPSSSLKSDFINMVFQQRHSIVFPSRWKDADLQEKFCKVFFKANWLLCWEIVSLSVRFCSPSFYHLWRFDFCAAKERNVTLWDAWGL